MATTTTTFTLELQLAAAAPALANGALLLADGNVQKYVDAIKVLYQANSLPCPNLTPLLDMVTVTPPSMFHVVMTTPPVSLTNKNSSHLYEADESALDANICDEVAEYHKLEEVPIIDYKTLLIFSRNHLQFKLSRTPGSLSVTSTNHQRCQCKRNKMRNGCP